MAFPEIRFGTDGWRAIIAETFTTDRVVAVVDAVLATGRVQNAIRAGIPLVVGFDARFLAERFSWLVAERLCQAGANVVLGDEHIATPGLGCEIVARQAALGLILTASHNPPEYLGIKIKGPWGGSATSDIYDEVALRLPRVEAAGAPPRLPDAPPPDADRVDMNRTHLDRLAAFLSPSPGRGEVIVHDAMFGSGRRLLARALTGSGTRVVNVRAARNPGFGGVGPEPVPERLGPMFRATRRAGAAFGVATDGDADRIAACDEHGTYVYPHEIFALMLDYLARDRGMRGTVVRNLATSELVRKVAEAHGCAVQTTPVGFKHIVRSMLDGGVLIGGEESGGIAVPEYLPERDGIMCALVLREAVLARKQSLREQLDALSRAYGTHCYRRWDLHLDEADKARVMGTLRTAPPDAIAGRRIERVETLDGVKLWFSDGGWMLVRPSGTEPLLRVYIEQESLDAVRAVYHGFSDWSRA